jgi:hypothetical protein
MTVLNTENIVVIIIPPVPGPDATVQEWDIYIRAVSVNNDAILRSNWAQAQQNTADAMNRAVDAQIALTAALNSPAPRSKPTREELVWDALKSLPEVTGLTDLTLTDLAKGKVEDYLKRFPGAIDAASLGAVGR